MIPITLVTLGEDMFEWDFEITGGSTLFITFETPQIGYTNAWGTLYNDDVFGSADVFQTIAPIPSPGGSTTRSRWCGGKTAKKMTFWI